MQRKPLGVVVDGAFEAGLTVRLTNAEAAMEDLRVGTFVAIEGQKYTFFSMIDDMQLRTTDPRLVAAPPTSASRFISEALAGTVTYGALVVKPMLMMPNTSLADPAAALVGAREALEVQTVRTIPMHGARLCEACEADFSAVFGAEASKERTYFRMGSPIAMDEASVCLDLGRLMERSTGVFGQSGTGKSFLARILLCGLIKNDVGVNLIFDMHDEYSYGKRAENKNWAKGLKHIFGSRVSVYSLDEEATRRAGRAVDAALTLGRNQIKLGDLLLLGDLLSLSDTAETSAHLLQRHFGDRWLSELMRRNEAELDEFADEVGAHPQSLGALWRAVQRLDRGYIRDHAEFSTIDQIEAELSRGKHVILQFGQYNSLLDYLLVSNIVTRRVRELYRKKVEQYERTKDAKDEPRPLMITIEEAHKFLNPAVAKQTIFGEIAREMRKYFVTLMIIDQRPSGIDPEILSQIGTRVSGRLTDEPDINAVLSGVSGRSNLKSALASLSTQQEVLVMGHAVPMPVLIRTRPYDDEFYKAMGSRESARLTDEERERKLKEIGME